MTQRNRSVSFVLAAAAALPLWGCSSSGHGSAGGSNGTMSPVAKSVQEAGFKQTEGAAAKREADHSK